jgi:hypothetical protein
MRSRVLCLECCYVLRVEVWDMVVVVDVNGLGRERSSMPSLC